MRRWICREWLVPKRMFASVNAQNPDVRIPRLRPVPRTFFAQRFVKLTCIGAIPYGFRNWTSWQDTDVLLLVLVLLL